MDSIQLARTRADHPLIGTVVNGKYCVVGLLHRGRRNDLFVAQETVRNDVRSLVLKIPHERTVRLTIPNLGQTWRVSGEHGHK